VKDTKEELETYERWWRYRRRNVIGTILLVAVLEVVFYSERLYSLMIIQPVLLIGGLELVYYLAVWRPMQKLKTLHQQETGREKK
jgi:hypothetical protein